MYESAHAIQRGARVMNFVTFTPVPAPGIPS
jgi:hypothetical protein